MLLDNYINPHTNCSECFSGYYHHCIKSFDPFSTASLDRFAGKHKPLGPCQVVAWNWMITPEIGISQTPMEKVQLQLSSLVAKI